MFSKKSKTEKEIIMILEPVLKEMGYELVDLNFKKEKNWILRIFIDNDNGITLDDCEKASRFIGDILDGNNLINTHYNLELSSPGINRPLTREEDFIKYAGKKVFIQLKEQYINRKNFKGIIKGIIENNVEIEENESNTYNIPLNLIFKARLDII